MTDRIDGIDTPQAPTRADRAQDATRMMEEAWAADAAAREAQRVSRPAPTGLPEASAFEPAVARARPPLTGAEPAPAAAPSPDGPRLSPAALAAQVRPSPEVQRELRAATTALEGARGAREQADQELGRRLAAYGPALSPEQIQGVTRAYRQQHAGVYEAERTATARLSTLLRERGDVLQQQAATPEGARTLARGLGALAQSAEAPQAVEFAGRVMQAGGPAAQNLRAQPNFERDVIERGVPQAAAIIASRAEGPNALQETVREVSRIAGPLVSGGVQGNQAVQQMNALLSGNMDAVRNLAQNWSQSGLVMRTLGVAGLAVSGALAGHSTAQGQSFAQQLEAYGRAAQSGAELGSHALRAMTGAARAALDTSAATRLARLAPGLGLVANAASLAHNGSQFARTGNPGFAIAATGDALATIGSAIGSFPPTAVPGAFVNAVGQVISAGGDLLANRIADSRSREEQVRALGEAGVPAAAAGALVENASGARELARLGYSPQQIQALAGRSGQHLAQSGDVGVVTRAAERLGLDRAATQQVLERLAPTELWGLARGLQMAGGAPEQRAFIEGLVQRSGYSPQAREALRALLAN
jgi:hypothetical protein